MYRVASLLILAWVLAAGRAEEARVAVAANFAPTARTLSEHYARASGHRVVLSSGSTGQLFVQIREGAPFDVYLAADGARPAKAEEEGLAVPGTRFPYAFGKLVLYTAEEGSLAEGESVLQADRFDRLAMATPGVAPYGSAAREVLQHLGLWDRLEPKIVYGKNVAQALQFVATGNAELGFVALSQVKTGVPGAYWKLPAKLYSPIRQEAVLLIHGRENPAARGFLAYLRSPEARELISQAGYEVEAP